MDDENDNPPKFLQMVVMQDEDIEIVDTNESKLKFRYASSDIEHESLQSDSDNSGSSLKPSVLLPPIISLSENVTVGTSIIKLLADDKDANSSITYKIIKEVVVPSNHQIGDVNTQSKKHFLVDSNSGEVTIATKLFPETKYRLTVSAFDNGGYTDNVTLVIYVKDVNDHAPVFSESSYDFDLVEGVYSNHILGKVQSSDADYGDNANVTYTISYKAEEIQFPFRISETEGEIYVFGHIDREIKASYIFEVIASDNAKEEPKLTASVLVEVHITDINDNPPEFFHFDRLLELPRYQLEDLENSSEEGSEVLLVPVYYATVQENTALGVPIIKISANDSDFPGSGNGLFLFDIIRKKNFPTFFEIDSKEGIVAVANKLDYEHIPIHNVTVIASDLGKPSLTSTALLIVSIMDVPEDDEDIREPIFDHKYYEVEVEENLFPPLELLTVNVSEKYRDLRVKYSIVPGLDSSEFNINPTNGTLSLLVKPDRETKAKYEIKIRVDKIKRARGMVSFIYPPPAEKMIGLGKSSPFKYALNKFFFLLLNCTFFQQQTTKLK